MDYKNYKCPAVYKITNVLNNKIYIGKSINFYNRYKHHKYNKLSTYISRAFQKYGFDNFKFEIIEFPNKEDLSKREQFYLDYYKSYNKEVGYNIRSEVDDNVGFKHSKQTKEIISNKLKGRKPWHSGKTNVEALYWNEERKLNHGKLMAGGNNPNAKAVIQLTLDNNFIALYPSCREASLASGANSKKIAAAASGYKIKKKNGNVYIKKTAGNFKWKWQE